LLCCHRIHHNHVRYFGKGCQTVSFEHQEIELLEVALPPARIHGARQGSALQFWQEELRRVHEYAETVGQQAHAHLTIFEAHVDQAMDPGRREVAVHTFMEYRTALRADMDGITSQKDALRDRLQEITCTGPGRRARKSMALRLPCAASTAPVIGDSACPQTSGDEASVKLEGEGEGEAEGEGDLQRRQTQSRVADVLDSNLFDSDGGEEDGLSTGPHTLIGHEDTLALDADLVALKNTLARTIARWDTVFHDTLPALVTRFKAYRRNIGPASQQPAPQQPLPAPSEDSLSPRSSGQVSGHNSSGSLGLLAVPGADGAGGVAGHTRTPSGDSGGILSMDVLWGELPPPPVEQPLQGIVGDLTGGAADAAGAGGGGSRAPDRDKSLMKKISQFLPTNSPLPRHLKSPFPATEHHLQRGSRASHGIVVYEDEPSSIIAYTLASYAHHKFAQRRDGTGRGDPHSNTHQATPASPPSQPGEQTTIAALASAAAAEGDGASSPGTDTDNPSPQGEQPVSAAAAAVPEPSVPAPDAPPTTTAAAVASSSGAGGADDSGLSEQAGLAPKSPKGEPKHHFQAEFSDGQTKFYCRVFFAREFCELRKLIMPGTGERSEAAVTLPSLPPEVAHLHIACIYCFNRAAWGRGCAACHNYLLGQHPTDTTMYGCGCTGNAPDDDEFIRSLSRCVKWDAHGGKSGADFCKMADERFILKQMNQSEGRSMLEFMPQYFKYMKETTLSDTPTV